MATQIELVKCPDCGEMVHFVTIGEVKCCPACGVIQEESDESK